jgi:unsaturated chondroitin disaccharide hydrolase
MKSILNGRCGGIIILFFAVRMVSAASLPDTMLTGMWNFSLTKLRATMTALGNNTTQFPRSASQSSGTWTTVAASDWASGFYPGCLWLAYEKSGDTLFRYNAQRWTASLYGQRTDTTTHDVGFEIFTSYGNGYRLLGTASYLPVILAAAQSLAKRYRPLAGIIDSWSFAPYDTGWEAIIDNMMNLELLFWASQNGAGQSYYDTALSHANKTKINHFRPDSTTYHVVKYSRSNGSVISRETRQGYSNSSCWARGQSWTVHGFTMARRFTGDTGFLNAARKAADYFIYHLPADRIPYWDFKAPGIGGTPDTTPRDASAAAIVAAALFELSTFVGAADSVRYRDSAISIIKGLWTTKYRGLSTQSSIVNHCTGGRPQNTEVDVGLIYADYYFLQALLRYQLYSGITAIQMPRVNSKKNIVSLAPVPQPFDLLGRKIRMYSDITPPGIFIIRTVGTDEQSLESHKVLQGGKINRSY